MTYFVGGSPQDILQGLAKKYLYGLRRNDDGELFLTRVDQLDGGAENSIVINEQGTGEDNFPDFEEGVNYLDGVNETHDIVYPNLRYPQLKWDSRSLTFYVEEGTGQFVQRVSEDYVYPEKISTPGYGEGVDSQVLANTDFTDAARE
jgi:hypothetical protein